MDPRVKLDDRLIVEEALRVMRSSPRTVPEERVRKFLALVGEEIQKSGTLRKEVVDKLLQQAKSGAI